MLFSGSWGKIQTETQVTTMSVTHCQDMMGLGYVAEDWDAFLAKFEVLMKRALENKTLLAHR